MKISDKIIPKLNEKGWNVYEYPYGLTTRESFFNGAANKLEKGRRYIIAPKCSKNASVDEVYNQMLYQEHNNQPTVQLGDSTMIQRLMLRISPFRVEETYFFLEKDMIYLDHIQFYISLNTLQVPRILV